ncbi:MAG: DUF4416 family protein [Leptospiraceae bacterium]|nr:DUF4416 family protein [Leptospiraceae bacterium]MCP5500995.1 DUF4416 family protein [Leptospiraceae bacterium]
MFTNPVKENLVRPGNSSLFLLLSFESLETYLKVKQNCQSAFSEILFESNPLPKWTPDSSEGLQIKVGSNTRIFSFKKQISRESLPDIKKKCIKIRNKNIDKDPSLKIIPGYLSSHNVILSATSDDFHRIYLHHGVYAEIIYKYEKLRYHPLPEAASFFSQQEVKYFFTTLREAFIKSIKD